MQTDAAKIYRLNKRSLPENSNVDQVVMSNESLCRNLAEQTNKILNIESPSLEINFFRHIQTYSQKTNLINGLKFIYTMLQNNRITSDSKVAIAIKLDEGARNCTPGFHNRVNEIMAGFFQPESPDDFLLQMRSDIVERAARKTGNKVDVHTFNDFFNVAHREGYAVDTPNFNDPHHGGVRNIKERLNSAFAKEYSPVAIVNTLPEFLEMALRTGYGYTGRNENGYLFGDYGKIQTFFNKFLDYKKDIDFSNLFILSEELGCVIDINWHFVRHTVFEKLVNNGYVILSEQERIFFHTLYETTLENPLSFLLPINDDLLKAINDGSSTVLLDLINHLIRQNRQNDALEIWKIHLKNCNEIPHECKNLINLIMIGADILFVDEYIKKLDAAPGNEADAPMPWKMDIANAAFHAGKSVFLRQFCEKYNCYLFKDDGALIQAFYNNNDDLFRMILAGCSDSLLDECRNNLLSQAFREGRENLFTVLLERCSDNDITNTLTVKDLAEAINNNHFSGVKAVLLKITLEHREITNLIYIMMKNNLRTDASAAIFNQLISKIMTDNEIISNIVKTIYMNKTEAMEMATSIGAQACQYINNETNCFVRYRNNHWYPATVIAVDGNQLNISYQDYPKLTEWIDSNSSQRLKLLPKHEFMDFISKNFFLSPCMQLTLYCLEKNQPNMALIFWKEVLHSSEIKQNDHIQLLSTLISKGADIQFIDEYIKKFDAEHVGIAWKMNIANAAISAGKADFLRQFCEKYNYIFSDDGALIQTFYTNDSDLFQVVLERCSDDVIKNVLTINALIEAINNNQFACVNAALSRITLKDSEITDLIYAIIKNNTKNDDHNIVFKNLISKKIKNNRNTSTLVGALYPYESRWEPARNHININSPFPPCIQLALYCLAKNQHDMATIFWREFINQDNITNKKLFFSQTVTALKHMIHLGGKNSLFDMFYEKHLSDPELDFNEALDDILTQCFIQRRDDIVFSYIQKYSAIGAAHLQKPHITKICDLMHIIHQKSHDLEKRHHTLAAKTSKNLYTTVSAEIISYCKGRIKYTDLRDRCETAINKARPELSKHRGWKRILGNLGLAIAGLVVGYLVAGIINLAVNKRFLFFQTDSVKNLDNMHSMIKNMNPDRTLQPRI